MTAYQERKATAAETGICMRCPLPIADDSLFCEGHRDAERAYKRKYKRRVTARNKRAKLCVCGRQRRRGQRRCLRCRIMRGALTVIPDVGVENQVEKTERVAAATRKHEDGRTRFHGQQKRGSQPIGQLNRQDLGFASREFEAGKRGLALLDTEEVKAMPRGERDGIKSAALHQLARAVGHIEDVQERMGHFKQRHGRRDGE